jgi:hypothetical protein
MAKTQIKSLSMEQLLSHLEAVDMVCDFYDNEMKANTGQYDGEEVNAYDAANGKLLGYMKIREKIFNEIETRVNELC